MEAEALRGARDAYVLADRLLIDRFRRLVGNYFVNCLKRDWFQEPARFETFSYAFENIPSDRPVLQLLLVNDYCDYWPEGKDDYDDSDPEDKANLRALNELPRAFLMRAMRRMGDFRNGRPNETAHKRCYHEHGSEEEQKACGRLHRTTTRRLNVASSSSWPMLSMTAWWIKNGFKERRQLLLGIEVRVTTGIAQLTIRENDMQAFTP
jgi:hypothetical protein